MTESLVGQEVVVDVGPVAHGGHHVARYDGRVIFVRHAVAGEHVRVRLTEGHSESRFLRGDAIEVLAASPDRVDRPCPYAGPGLCGGCDFQHIALPRQRSMLAAVVTEQLQRLAGISWEGEVEPVPGDEDGLGWRTRVRFASTSDRRPGLHRHRSDDVVPIDRCLIADPRLPDVSGALRDGAAEAQAVVSSTGERVVVTSPAEAPIVTESLGGLRFQVHAGDFWQVHPGAAQALTSAVMTELAPRSGSVAGTCTPGPASSPPCSPKRWGVGGVVAVESHRRSAADLCTNVADRPQVRTVAQPVEKFVRSRAAQGRLDLVVVDPPQSGAGKAVVAGIARQRPRAVAYVACDPAALARDLATFAAHGYQLQSLRAFDLFPMTHHVECVGVLERSPAARTGC
ncbi:MAG: TRAM domain-containing protein [Nocardioidaceae bacterium]